jgi:flagellar protein FlgJ
MIQNPAIYHDFAGLRNLQADAARETPEAAREAARQFEALFVQMMLKSMRDASSVLAEERDTTYEEMFDQQVALELTRDKGLGIADLLVRQLSPGHAAETANHQRRADNARVLQELTALPASQRQDWQPAGPEQFVRDVWPHAEQAAVRLGVDPKALVAQAALETGWGQKLIRDRDGVSGNNLFGIKADQRWDGEKLTVTTLEYDGGIARRQHDQFRAYPNLRESFEDYVGFLKDNPRYDEAIRGGLSAEDFASSLQEAGYATDPHYADKIRGILKSLRIDLALGGLKDSPDLPT